MKQKRVVFRLIEQAKRDHYSSIVTDCNGDQKRLFHVINDLLNRKKDEIFPDTICDQDLANRFLDFFVKKILTIRDAFEIFNAKDCLDVHIQLNNPIMAYYDRVSTNY